MNLVDAKQLPTNAM